MHTNSSWHGRWLAQNYENKRSFGTHSGARGPVSVQSDGSHQHSTNPFETTALLSNKNHRQKIPFNHCARISLQRARTGTCGLCCVSCVRHAYACACARVCVCTRVCAHLACIRVCECAPPPVCVRMQVFAEGAFRAESLVADGSGRRLAGVQHQVSPQDGALHERLAAQPVDATRRVTRELRVPIQLLCYRTDGVFCLDFLRISTETASVQ